MPVGSSAATPESTNIRNTRIAAPPAVLRVNGESAMLSSQTMVMMIDVTITSRSTWGAVIETSTWWTETIAWVAKNAITLAVSVSANTTDANTTSLAHNSGRRRG